MTQASRVGADVTTAAVGAVEGAIDPAKTLSLDVEEAASVAATGAVEAGAQISDAAALRVRRAVEATINRVKVVLLTSLGKDLPKDDDDADGNRGLGLSMN